MDYIFECDPSESRSVKAKKVLSELQRKTAVYQRIRRMRAPVTMEKYLGQRPPRISGDLQYASPPPQVSESPNTIHSVETPDYAPEVPMIGRAPVQYAGVTNGESLWALPYQQSPEASSDSNSGGGHLPGSGSGMDDFMTDIDWVNLRSVPFTYTLINIQDAFDALFPPNQTDNLEYPPEFRFPEMFRPSI